MTKAAARKRDKNASATHVVGRPFAMAGKRATARQDAPEAGVARVKNARGGPGRPFKAGNSGRPKGSKNKVTKLMLESAREAFAPMAELTIKRGTEHLTECEEDECVRCRHYESLAIPYVYGKPTQQIDIDSSALEAQIQELMALSGKSREEVERDAARAGTRASTSTAAASSVARSDGGSAMTRVCFRLTLEGAIYVWARSLDANAITKADCDRLAEALRVAGMVRDAQS